MGCNTTSQLIEYSLFLRLNEFIPKGLLGLDNMDQFSMHRSSEIDCSFVI